MGMAVPFAECGGTGVGRLAPFFTVGGLRLDDEHRADQRLFQSDARQAQEVVFGAGCPAEVVVSSVLGHDDGVAPLFVGQRLNRDVRAQQLAQGWAILRLERGADVEAGQFGFREKAWRGAGQVQGSVHGVKKRG